MASPFCRIAAVLAAMASPFSVIARVLPATARWFSPTRRGSDVMPEQPPATQTTPAHRLRSMHGGRLLRLTPGLSALRKHARERLRSHLVCSEEGLRPNACCSAEVQALHDRSWTRSTDLCFL